MKKIFLSLMILSLLYSCNEKNNEINDEFDDPYELPWKTEYIHYENIPMCNGNHSSGYKLYYKDSLLKEECIEFGGISISDSMLVNDSILHLFLSGSNGSHVLTTVSGGCTWEQFVTGPPQLLKLHFVNTELMYCITQNLNDLYFTGVRESDLSMYKDSLTEGTHYIPDLGTNILDLDSTLIAINDSVDFVILFK